MGRWVEKRVSPLFVALLRFTLFHLRSLKKKKARPKFARLPSCPLYRSTLLLQTIFFLQHHRDPFIVHHFFPSLLESVSMAFPFAFHPAFNVNGRDTVSCYTIRVQCRLQDGWDATYRCISSLSSFSSSYLLSQTPWLSWSSQAPIARPPALVP